MKKTKNNTKICRNDYSCANLSGAEQPLTNFHKYSRSKDGYKDECKECRLTYQADYDFRNSGVRAVKRRVYKTYGFNDEKQVAFNYLAKQLGIKTKVNGVGIDSSIKTAARNATKKNFATTEEQRIAFNLLSYQLGQNARA
jgi:hypothetical protein